MRGELRRRHCQLGVRRKNDFGPPPYGSVLNIIFNIYPEVAYPVSIDVVNGVLKDQITQMHAFSQVRLSMQSFYLCWTLVSENFHSKAMGSRAAEDYGSGIGSSSTDRMI